jgi:putative acetyltransferase
VLSTEQEVRLDFGPSITLVRALMLEYADQLGIDLCFQDFESEMAMLPGRYAEPGGGLIVAFVGEQAAGCAAFRPLTPGICEMKRLYLRADYRGKGLGRAIATAVMDRACAAGYRAMRLDTLSAMKIAIGLYESLGFRQIPPYYDTPLSECVFLEASLLR